MKKLTNLLKSLLVVAMLGIGSNAWAEEASLDPVGVFTWTNAPAITYDGSATSWAINQGGISGDKIGKYAGPYAIVKFDASVISGKTLLSAKLDFDITAGSYNSSINIAQMSDASFDPATVTTVTFDATATQFQAGDWSTKNTTKHFSYDVAARVKESNVIAFAIYTNTAREQTLKNVKLNLEYSAAAVEKFEYELNAVDESESKIKTLASGEEYEGKTVTAYFPYMFYEEGKLYTTASSPYSVSLDKDNKVKTVTYTKASSSIVAYMEGESADADSGEDAAYSNGKWGHAAGNVTSVISTLPAGKYTATIYLKANGNRSIVLRNTANSDVETNVIVSLPINKNSAAGVYTSDEFLITKTTTIGFSGYTSGTKTNQSADIDYILITKTGEAPQYPFTAQYYNSASWENVYAYTYGDETLGAWPGTKLTATDGVFDVSFEAAAAPDGIIFNNGNGGDGNQTADLAFVDGASYNSNGRLYNYTATFTTNLGWENVYAYVWSGENASKVEQLGGWPGTEITATKGVYNVNILANASPEYIIFHNYSGAQTSDLVFVDGDAYSWNNYTVTFITEWANVNAWAWNVVEETPVNLCGEWPGTAMSGSEGLFTWNYIGEKAPEMILFNNGSDKTSDFTFFNGATYNINGAFFSKSITSAGWATYCSPYALDFTNAIANLEAAYIVTGGADGVLEMTEVKGIVPANTGLLLKGEGDVAFPVASSDANVDVSANKLEGVTENTVIAAEAGYVLMASPSLGFYKNNNDFTVGANTAYLPVGFDATVGGARFFLIEGGIATGISDVRSKMEDVRSFYDLQGRRVAQPTKGLYINKGKKVVVK